MGYCAWSSCFLLTTLNWHDYNWSVTAVVYYQLLRASSRKKITKIGQYLKKIERISVIKYTHCMLTGPRAYDPGVSVCSAGVVDPGSTWRLIGCWLCECWWEACRRISSYLRVMCLCRSIVSALSFCPVLFNVYTAWMMASERERTSCPSEVIWRT